MKKRLVLLLCMIACVFSLVACNSEKDDKSLEYDEAVMKPVIETYITNLSKLSKAEAEAELEKYKEGSPEYGWTKAWVDNCEDLGTLESIDKYEFSSDKDNVICKVSTTYSERKAEYSFVFPEDGDMSLSITPKYSLGETMTKAGINTLLGMGTVFMVLILISIIISMFEFINKFEQAAKKKKEAVSETANVAKVAVDNTIAQIVVKEENEANNLELVAVITAAIAASEGTSADGLVVRSIRRVKKSNWQRA